MNINIEKIADMYKSGKSTVDISKIFRVFPSRISRILKKSGIRMRTLKEARALRRQTKEFPKEIINKIIKMYNKNINMTIIGKALGSDYRSIKKILIERNIKIRSLSDISRKYNFDEKYFDKLDGEGKNYWLGFILADGNISKNNNTISVCSKDIDHLKKFKKCICAKNKIYIDKRTGVGTVFLYSEKTKNDLVSLGIIPNKSLVVKPPKIDRKYEKDFWRGVIDGDGFIIVEKSLDIPRIGICGSYYTVMGFIDFVSNRIGVGRKIPSIHKNIYEVKYACSSARKIIEYLYCGSKIYLNRKNKMARKILQRYADK